MLDNDTRLQYGLKEIKKGWKQFQLNGKPLLGSPSQTFFVSEQNIIEKSILVDYDNPHIKFIYKEIDYEVQLNSNHDIIGKRGKVQKLTPSTLDKFTSKNKTLIIVPKGVSLQNSENHQIYLGEHNHSFKSPNEGIDWLKKTIGSLSSFEKEYLERFKFGKRQKQKIKSGDIFRVRFGIGRYGYGRVITNLKKLKDYIPKQISDYELDFRGSHILSNPMILDPVWVDFFNLNSDNPYLTENELEKYGTSPSVIINGGSISVSQYQVIDSFNIKSNIDSFDVPMDIVTQYNYTPTCHIFKWGLGVIAFPPNDSLEQLKNLRYPQNYQVIHCNQTEGIEYFINSILEGNMNFRANSFNGDIREKAFNEMRKIIGNCIGFDLGSSDYDSFATKFGFLTKGEIIKLCIE